MVAAKVNVLLLHLDGKLPNIALMRISAHHKALGDDVTLRRTGHPEQAQLDDPYWDKVYASVIFEKSRFVAERLVAVRPDAVIGGTGWSISDSLENHGISTLQQDYSIYPGYMDSIGFSQRGCRLKCGFCIVPRKEGAIRSEQSINEIWRGEPFPKNISLLDNDFFGAPGWESRIDEIKSGNFRVSLSQGINVRFITDEAAAAIASVDYRDDGFQTKRIYTAWDNRKDEQRLFRGLDSLLKYGVKPFHIMVYMLIGYWPGETEEDWLHRANRLIEFGALPYPMPFVRNKVTLGFQRWLVGRFYKWVSWEEWKRASYQPYGLHREQEGQAELQWI